MQIPFKKNFADYLNNEKNLFNKWKAMAKKEDHSYLEEVAVYTYTDRMNFNAILRTVDDPAALKEVTKDLASSFYENAVLLQKYIKEHPVRSTTTVYRRITSEDPIAKAALSGKSGVLLEHFTSTTKIKDAGNMFQTRNILVEIKTFSGCDIEHLAVVKNPVVL